MTEEPPPLLDAETCAVLPPLYATEEKRDPVVHVKLFTPWAGWTWYVTEFDGEDTLFGLVVGQHVEMGYFSLSELQGLHGLGGLRVERDLYFAAKPLSEVRSGFYGVKEQHPNWERRERAPAYPGAARDILDPMCDPAIRLVETRLVETWSSATGDVVKRPADAARVLRGLIGSADREHFAALFLNVRHQVTHAHVVSVGTVSSAPVHPREVFKAAVLANASALIVGHNHPSGDVTPSADDQRTEERLSEVGKILGVPLLDSVIVGPCDRFHSSSSGSLRDLLPSTGGERPDNQLS